MNATRPFDAAFDGDCVTLLLCSPKFNDDLYEHLLNFTPPTRPERCLCDANEMKIGDVEMPAPPSLYTHKVSPNQLDE